MKRLGIVIGALLAVGLVFALTGLAMGAKMGIYWDSAGVHAVGKNNPSDHFVVNMPDTAPFTNVKVSMINHDIEFIASDHYGFEVLNCNYTDIDWKLEDGTLTITEQPCVKFGVDLNFLRNKFSSGSYLKVYLPADASMDNIHIRNVSGVVSVSEVSCWSLWVSIVSGRTEIENVVGHNRLAVESVSGRINMRNCRAEEIALATLSGGASLSGLRTTNSFLLNSASGRLDISGEFLGMVGIHSTSGDIRLQIDGKSTDYRKSFSLTSGRLTIDGQRYNITYSEQTSAYNHLTVTNISGDVNVNFSQ